jgi:Uncharacterised protein family (UPF0160)
MESLNTQQKLRHATATGLTYRVALVVSTRGGMSPRTPTFSSLASRTPPLWQAKSSCSRLITTATAGYLLVISSRNLLPRARRLSIPQERFCCLNSSARGRCVQTEPPVHPLIPLQEHLFELEGEDGGGFLEPGAATYIIYPDEIGGSWRVQAVPVSPQSFDSRKALPEAWRGVRDDALSQLTGIDGGVFVHASGFIGGTNSQ